MAGRQAFSRAVIARDNGKCVKCGSTEGVRAHRIKSPESFPHLALDPTNGQTLCKRCGDKAYKRRSDAKPRRDTLERHIADLKQEVEDLRAANDLLRQNPGTLMPLDYVLLTLNSPEATKEDKQWAAATGLPYMHRRMPLAIEGGERDKPLRIATHDQLRLLSPEQFAALQGVYGGVVKAIPSPEQVMAGIAEVLLEAERVDGTPAPLPRKGNGADH